MRYAKIVFKDHKQINDVEGNILFEFYSDHETKNQTTRIVLNYNMSTNQIDKLEFEQGHGKRVGGPAYPIDDGLSKIPISKLISDLYIDNEFQEKIKLANPRLEIEYTYDIDISLYDNNKYQGLIYRKLISDVS